MSKYYYQETNYISDFAQKKVVDMIFCWLTLGIGVTTLCAYIVSILPLTIQMYEYIFIASAIISFVFLFAINSAKNSSSSKLLYFAFAINEGIMLSSIFLVYQLMSIVVSLGVTTFLFLLMFFIGKTTKINLLEYGSFFFFGLIGIIIASILNIFIASTALEWVTTYVAIVLFFGLIMYDAQAIKADLAYVKEYDDYAKRLSIKHALSLYLDFINLLLQILKILGKKK